MGLSLAKEKATVLSLKKVLNDGKDFKMPGIVPKLSDTPGSADWVGPELGAHNHEVLGDLGYDVTAINNLKLAGAI